MDEPVPMNSVPAAAGSVKLHVFKPSGKKLWTVVGKEEEYWVDPELSFCSCRDYYFVTLSEGTPCYHLRSVNSVTEYGVEVFEFHDEEYLGFLQAVAGEAEKALVLR